MTLLQALNLAKKLEKSHIKVLKWFIENGQLKAHTESFQLPSMVNRM